MFRISCYSLRSNIKRCSTICQRKAYAPINNCIACLYSHASSRLFFCLLRCPVIKIHTRQYRVGFRFDSNRDFLYDFLMRELILIDVSVIVPVYNASNSIEQCLQAIRNQQGIDPSRMEVIVVDDASTDSSASKASPLCEKLISLQDNRGAATARNIGARAASGEIIVFVDSDVILEPYALSIILDVFKKDKSISAAVGRYSEDPAEQGFFNVYHNSFTRYHHDLSPQEIEWFWGGLGAVRKDVFTEVGGFDERYQGASGEDLAFGRNLFDRGYRIVYLPEAQGGHAHPFTFWGMLKNDYIKAVLGIKMKLSGDLPQNAPAFANGRSAATSLLLTLCPFLIFINYAPFLIRLAIVFSMVCPALLIINTSYYRYLSKKLNAPFILLTPFLHWLQMYAILLGVMIGILGYFRGRTAFGRPKWM